MSSSYVVLNSPLGEILVTVNDGTVTGLYQEGQPNKPQLEDIGENDPSLRFHPVAGALHRYFNGTPESIATPVSAAGTAFQKKVWRAVSEIPYGKTQTYADVAASIGSPKSVRAVATAVAANPITVIVPCHRVVSQNGDIKYSGGSRNKDYLLALESGRS